MNFKGLLSKGVYEVKFVSSLISVYVLPGIKFPYPNSFKIFNFWIDSFRSICITIYKNYLVMHMFSDVKSRAKNSCAIGMKSRVQTLYSTIVGLHKGVQNIRRI